MVTAVSSLIEEMVSEVQSCSTINEDTCISECILDTLYRDVHDSDTVFYHSADSKVVHMPENYHFQTPHRLIRQLRVDDRRVDIVVEHFDVTRQMLSTLSWSALMTDEQDSGGFSMADFHALHKAMGILKQDLYYPCCDSALPSQRIEL